MKNQTLLRKGKWKIKKEKEKDIHTRKEARQKNMWINQKKENK